MPYIPEQIHFCSVTEKKKKKKNVKNVLIFYLLNAKVNHNCMRRYLLFVLISLALAKIYYSPVKLSNLFYLRELRGPLYLVAIYGSPGG